MKRILSILGAIGLTATASSTVVSCNSNKISNLIKINGSFDSDDEKDFYKLAINPTIISYIRKSGEKSHIPGSGGKEDNQFLKCYAVMSIYLSTITINNNENDDNDDKCTSYINYIFIDQSSYNKILNWSN